MRLDIILMLRRIFFAVTMYILPVLSFAQQRKTDSLKALLPGKTDLERADIFYGLAYAYGELDYRLAATYCNRSFQFARISGDSLRIVKAARIKTSIFRRLEEMDSSIILGLEMLPIASRNGYNDEVKKILRGLALAYTYKANYDLGLEYNFKLLRMTAHDHDSLEQRFTLNNIGFIYFKLMNNRKALQYFLRALDTYRSLKGPQEARGFLNVGLCYSHLGDFHNAAKYIKGRFDYSQSNGEGTLAIEGLQVSGTFHFLKGKLDSAEAYYSKSYLLAKRLDNERFQLVLATQLADVYLERNQISSAHRCLSEVESLLQKTTFSFELVWVYYNLARLYQKMDDPRGRVFYQQNYIHFKDNLYNRAMMNSLTRIESEFHERSNRNRITEQEQLLELQDQVIRRQRGLNILAAVIATLLMSLLYILYRSNNRKKFVSQLLDQKVRERTQMLEASCLMTKRMVETHNAAVTKVLGDVRQQMATLSGLCVVGLTDRNRSGMERSLRKISLVGGNVIEILDGTRHSNPQI